MSELTKENLEQALKGLASKQDLQAAVAPLATSEQVEELARIVKSALEDIQDGLDVRDEIEIFRGKFEKLEEALHIKL